MHSWKLNVGERFEHEGLFQPSMSSRPLCFQKARRLEKPPCFAGTGPQRISLALVAKTTLLI